MQIVLILTICISSTRWLTACRVRSFPLYKRIRKSIPLSRSFPFWLYCPWKDARHVACVTLLATFEVSTTNSRVQIDSDRLCPHPSKPGSQKLFVLQRESLKRQIFASFLPSPSTTRKDDTWLRHYSTSSFHRCLFKASWFSAFPHVPPRDVGACVAITTHAMIE